MHSVAKDHKEVPPKEGIGWFLFYSLWFFVSFANIFSGVEKETTPCIFTMCVADTGIGMNAKEQARIFTRFSQANNRTSKVCHRDRRVERRGMTKGVKRMV